MVTKIFKLLVSVGILIFSYTTYAQPTFVIQNVKGACEGFNNGSFEVLVTAGTGTINVFSFGPPNVGPIGATVGVPLLISGLPGGGGAGRQYLVVVQDDGGSTSTPFPPGVEIPLYPVALAGTVDNVVPNTDCVVSNGSIDITTSGGSGPPNYTFSWTGPNGFTAITEDISGLLGGDYILTIGDVNTNCTRTLNPITIANPSPVLFTVTNPSPAIVCTGSDLVLTMNGSEVGATYEVIRNNVIATGITQVGNGNPINFTLPFGTFANGDNFKVRATNGICTGDMNGVVVATIVPLPTAATSGGGTVCSGDPLPNVTFTFTGTAPYTFTYTDGVTPVNVINHPTTTFTINNAPAGTYSVTALTGGNGCAATNLGGSVDVIVNASPVSAVLSGTATICSGSSTDLIVTITGGVGPYSITLDNGIGTINNYVSGTPIPVSPIVTTSYNMVGNVVDANGCSVAGSGTAMVTVNQPPTSAVLTGTATICEGTGTDLVVTITGGASPYSITIDNAVGTINNYVSGTPIPVSPAVSTTYNMVGNVVDANGCSVAGSGSAVVTVNPSPTSAVLSGDATICAGETTDLIVTITSGTAPFSITLDNGIGTIINYVSGTAIPVSPGATTTYNMVGNVIDANGCTVAGSGTATVTVNNPPTSAVLSGDATVCAGTSTDLSVTITGGTGPYSITLDNGVGTINNYVSGTPIPVTPLVTTTYNMVGNVVDANGCSVVGSGTATITVNQPPTSAVLSGTATICAGSSTDLIVTITGGNGPYSITLDNGIGTINNYISGTPIPVSPVATTTYNMVGNVVDANGCSVAGSGSATVTVNLGPTNAVLSGDATVCAGASTDLVVTITGGTGPYSITLDNGVGTINNYVSGTPIPVSPAATATYNLVGVVTDANGCSVAGSGTATITVNPLPVASISGTATICAGASTLLTFTLSPGTYDVVYTDGTSNFNANGIGTGATVSVSPAINTSYTIVSATNTVTGCSVTAPDPNITGTADITVDPQPTASIAGTATICVGSSTPLTFTLPSGTYDVVYTDGSSNFNANGIADGAIVNVSPAINTTYTIVSVTNTVSGCSVSAPDPGITGAADITVDPAPTASITGTTTICSGTNATLTFNLSAGTFDVVYTDGTSNFNLNGVSDGATTDVTPGISTTYTIVSVTNTVTGCVVTAPSPNITGSAVITVTPSPTATISGTASICDGSSTSLTVNFTGTGPWTFQYSDGTITSAAIPSFFNSISFPVSPTVNTTYTLVSVTDASVCPGMVAGSADITVSQNPMTNLAVGVTIDPVCSGGISEITVANSEVGVSYQLRNDADDSDVGSPVIGTGATINISTGVLLATTTFNVLATSGGCPPGELTTLATVNVAGSIDPDLTVTALANPICAGDATVIQIASSENGVLYQLRDDLDDSNIGAAVAGNGGTIDLPTGNLAVTTTFNVLASNGTCSIELTNTETIDVNPAADPALVVAAVIDPLCVGGMTDITIDLSQIGIDYQLRDDADDSPIGTPVAGTGATISLPTGVLNATTTFSVLATGTGCPPVELTTLVTVNVAGAVDASLLLTSVASPICEGTGTDIQIDNSEIGVDYQLRDDATDTPVGAPVAGTGNTILLPTGNLTATTTFNVIATNGVCSIELTDLETVDVDIAPDPALAVSTTIDPLCLGGVSEIAVALSQVGIDYQLRDDADDSPIGAPVAGTGGTINLSTGVLNVTTTFNILATSGGVCPVVELTTLATVNVGGAVDAGLTVTSTANPICAGGSTFIQVQNSEVGVTYQLRDDLTDTPIGAPVAGDGATIDLPTGNLLMTTTFNVLASNGACSIELADQETINITPGPALDLAVTPATALICPGSATNIVVAASEVGVSYQLRNNADNSPIGSAVAGTGANIILPTGNLAVNTTFNVFATQGLCAVQLTNTATVNIRPAGDPACGGGGSDCTNFSSIQPTIVTQPSCNDRDAGEVSFSISRTDGTPTTFRVIWSINGTNQTKFTSNTVSFNDLSSGMYQYTIIDEGNGKSCGPVDFFLDLKTQVEILTKQVTANVTCFGGTDGNAILSVDGSSTGEYWYKYVLNGVESGAQTFTPGAPLPGGLPADDTNFIIIKVDDNFAFTCPDTVMVRVFHTFPKIDFALTSTNVSTCNGTDGAIQVTGIGGGDPGSGPLQVRLKKAVPFGVDPSGYVVLVDFEDVVAGFKEYLTLSQGNYIVDVQDGIGCIQSQPIAVQAPGQVPLGVVGIVATDATCTNDGASGSILVTIGDAGMFQVALSQDQVNVPPDTDFIDYNSPSLPSITFDNLMAGNYYLYIKSSTTTCPTRTDAIAVGGVQALNDFDVLSSCDNVNLTINNLTGQRDAPFVIRVFNNSDKFLQIDSLTAGGIPLSNAVSFNYVAPLQHPFLTLPGTYRFVMVQNQTTGAGTCTLVSDTVVYDVRLGLGIVMGAVTPSYPNPKRTGSIMIENIVGGTRFLSAANELYYEISLHTADDDIMIFDWEEVKLNPQNKFAKLYDYLPPGVYRIKVRDYAGCVKTQDVEIMLDPTIFVPNIFTPNDDNVNDEFEVLNLPLTGTHRLIISNRWGNEVFTSKDYRVGNFWDARDAADGIYYYRLQVEGGDTYVGWVEVLRGSKP